MLRTSFLVSCAALLHAASPLQAAVLSVDFGFTTPATSLQNGFINWDTDVSKTRVFAVLDTISAPSGSITGIIAGGVNPSDMALNTNELNLRDRDFTYSTGAFTQTNLLKDRVVALSKSGAGADQGLFIQLTGLRPSTEFTIQVWGYDDYSAAAGVDGAKAGTFSLFDRTGGLNKPLGTYTTTVGDLPLDNNSFSVTGTVTSDAFGKIVVQSVSGMDGVGIANGFVLTAVPEPSSAILLGASCGLLGFVRRRRG